MLSSPKFQRPKPPVSGHLSFFGVLLKSEIPVLVDALQKDMFGLALHPVEHILKGHNCVYTEQSSPQLGQLTHQTLARLGLSYEWRASSIQDPSQDTEVWLFDATSGETLLCQQKATSSEREPLTLLTPAQRQIFDRWPDLFDLLDSTGAAQLHIAFTNHALMQFLASPPAGTPTWPFEGRLSATALQSASA
jgi:hypothetical protein